MTLQQVPVNLLALQAKHFSFVFMMSPKKLVFGCGGKTNIDPNKDITRDVRCVPVKSKQQEIYCRLFGELLP